MKKQNKYKINNKSQKKIRKKSNRKRTSKKKRSLKKKKSQVGSSPGTKVIQLSPNTISEDNVAETLARIRWRLAIESHMEAIRSANLKKKNLDENLPSMPSLSSSENIKRSLPTSEKYGVEVIQEFHKSSIS